ncbi:MAG TPA: anti-sigma regulatory factor [Clostridiaceae bacterium]|jgi:serine/threonine-protein kinase RsbW|nr:anti-sigma regulatory factor [Clostridiaceae bacterium]
MITNNEADTIEISLPFKAEYVSVARLTASAIANRIGFNIDEIEDVKVAVSEVCNKMVKYKSKTEEAYKIIFKITPQKLAITYDCEDKSLKCIFDNEEDKLAISLINAFMDYVEFCPENNSLFTMSKNI